MHTENTRAISHFIYSVLMSERKTGAATDVLSVLSIVGICAVAVMILVSSLMICAREASNATDLEIMRECGAETREIAIDKLTEYGENGLLYLYTDWRERLGGMKPATADLRIHSVSLEVRILGRESLERYLLGDTGNCTKVISTRQAVLYVEGQRTLPAELIVRMGI